MHSVLPNSWLLSQLGMPISIRETVCTILIIQFWERKFNLNYITRRHSIQSFARSLALWACSHDSLLAIWTYRELWQFACISVSWVSAPRRRLAGSSNSHSTYPAHIWCSEAIFPWNESNFHLVLLPPGRHGGFLLLIFSICSVQTPVRTRNTPKLWWLCYSWMFGWLASRHRHLA